MLSYLNSLKLFIGEDSERGSCAIRAFWCYQAQRRAPTVPWTLMKFSERDLENFWVEKGKTLLPSSLNKYSFDCCKALIKLWSCESWFWQFLSLFSLLYGEVGFQRPSICQSCGCPKVSISWNILLSLNSILTTFHLKMFHMKFCQNCPIKINSWQPLSVSTIYFLGNNHSSRLCFFYFLVHILCFFDIRLQMFRLFW